MAVNLRESKYLKKYANRMVDTMCRVNKNWNRKQVEDEVYKLIEKNLSNQTVNLDNPYTHENKNAKLLSIADWTLDRKPIIAGNATFFKPQHEAENPPVRMCNGWRAERTALKKKMFTLAELLGSDADEVDDLDIGQNNKKVLMNAQYGGSEVPTSPFYGRWCGPSTALTAQSVISTAETMFEALLADNYVYLDMNELIDWTYIILKNNKDFKKDDYIKPHTREELVDRLIGKILQPKKTDYEIYYAFVQTLTDDQVTMLYYKNNMIELIDTHDEIKNIFIDIFENVNNYEILDENDSNWLKKIPLEEYDNFESKTIKDWNKFVNMEYFMDPNNPPDSIKLHLEKIRDIIKKYVYCRYLSFDKIYRLRNFKRRVVTVIDTDSNFLSVDTLVNYIFNNVTNHRSFGREDIYNSFIIVNTVAYIITNIVSDIFEYYGECANIDPEYRGVFQMKNEYFLSLLVIGLTKKRYLSKQLLREGTYLNPPKSDTKGFDFKKSTTSDFAEAFFNRIIDKYILGSENGQIDVISMTKECIEFKKTIISMIRSGETELLPNASAKPAEGYADPGSEQSFRGVLTWNAVNPENLIAFPSKVRLLKLNIFTVEDLDKLKDTYPEVHERLLNTIFLDETGIFNVRKYDPGIDYVDEKDTKWVEKIPKYYRSKFNTMGPIAWNAFVKKTYGDKRYDGKHEGKWIVKSRGCQVIAIPSNAKIPEWCIDFIDYDTTANSIIAPFKPVLELFGPVFIREGKTHNGIDRKSRGVSNIIKF